MFHNTHLGEYSGIILMHGPRHLRRDSNEAKCNMINEDSCLIT